MPGVIMDSGSRNGSHTNHDRDQQSNGVNGERNLPDNDQEKGKGKEPQQNMTPTSPTRPNLLNGMGASLPSAAASRTAPADLQERVQQLPPEIAHITQGFLPLSTLLTRFSQKTHKEITTLISELAQMPLPAAAVNGNASHASTDDNSAENVNKKLRLLAVAEKAHSEWTKLYVVTSWSRNSEGVRKLIDLRNYLAQQAGLYDDAINRLGQFRVDLGAARIPNPDLKTAVQVLSTGKAPWMPEVRCFPRRRRYAKLHSFITSSRLQC
jgi:mediator of RNA polymerase II transcription subunit 14